MYNQLKIKVCGMREKNNISQLCALNPDYLGFIFYPKSKRFAGYKINEEILNIIPKNIKKTGVFVDEEPEKLKKIIRVNQLDVAQLHGNETPEYCEKTKKLNIGIIKTFSVGNDFDFKKINDYKDFCDYFLFDTQTTGFGGSGKKFNWEILKKYDNVKTVFLSGGISPEDTDNIKKLNWLHIHALDINSKFEIQPGLKDINKVKQFIKAMRDE